MFCNEWLCPYNKGGQCCESTGECPDEYFVKPTQQEEN